MRIFLALCAVGIMMVVFIDCARYPYSWAGTPDDGGVPLEGGYHFDKNGYLRESK